MPAGTLPTDDIKGFRELFSGREDVYGMVHGECKREPLGWHHWHAHLFGQFSLGVYPVVNGKTRWGATDIDTHGARGVTPEDAWVYALNLKAALKALGHVAWVELTKSLGYHVWVFATSWTPATDMRSTLLLAHQLADVPVVEVNPKQVDLAPGQVGNYVNLPFARNWATDVNRPTRIILSDTGLAWTLPDFIQQALACRSTPSQLAETAALYVPPAPRASVTLRPFSGALSAPVDWTAAGTSGSSSITDGALRAAAEKLSGKAWVIFRDGPNQGGRGFTLFRLGVECRDSGLSPDETLTVLVDADIRWGKYMERNNGLTYIERIVQDVF